MIKRGFSTHLSNELLQSKIKGCLIGGLVGDCYGKPYKLSEEVSKLQLQKYFDKLEGPYFKAPFKPYSVSSAFSNCVCESLLTEGKLNAQDITRRWAKAFFQHPHREYGHNISKIMLLLRGGKFADPYAPAMEQYLGNGSYGSKPATRVAPIVCFYLNRPDAMQEVVTKVSQLTHFHPLAINGALLQSWAIRIALLTDSQSLIDHNKYLDVLCEYVRTLEQDDDELGIDIKQYDKQLNLARNLLNKDSQTEEEVINTLGHGKIAVFSIPTAIYCFLRAMKPIPGIETENTFRRTVQLATALGGDTDTIASMAGTLAGAFCGSTQINESLQLHCEGIEEIKDLANRLCQVLNITSS